MTSKWPADVYASSEVIAATLPALCFFSRPSLLSPGQTSTTDVVNVRAPECAGSCYVEEQVKEVTVFLHKGSSPCLCWFPDLRIM